MPLNPRIQIQLNKRFYILPQRNSYNKSFTSCYQRPSMDHAYMS